MFLDRLSGHPTPSASPAPSQRSYSPAPRRQLSSGLSRSSLERPVNRRTSSLNSLVSRANSSTGSLPGTARLTNGSSLRQSTVVPPNVDDPVDVLEKIVGVPLEREGGDDGEEQEATERPNELLEDIEFGGLSLQAFVQTSPATKPEEGKSKELESVQSVEECEYVRLHAEYRKQC